MKWLHVLIVLLISALSAAFYFLLAALGGKLLEQKTIAVTMLVFLISFAVLVLISPKAEPKKVIAIPNANENQVPVVLAELSLRVLSGSEKEIIKEIVELLRQGGWSLRVQLSKDDDSSPEYGPNMSLVFVRDAKRGEKVPGELAPISFSGDGDSHP